MRLTTRRTAGGLALLLSAALLAACDGSGNEEARPPDEAPTRSATPTPTSSPQPPSVITLGFAGDVHFERHVARYLDRADQPLPLGPITRLLREPDLMMLNLETSILTSGDPEPKEYTFRTSPRALELLDRSGVDVVTMANNHGADYGLPGLRQTLEAKEGSPVPVVGVGADADEAYAPYRTRIDGTSLSIFGVNSRPGYTVARFAATDERPGVAVAVGPNPRLLRNVRKASEAGDAVIVYLHWGREFQQCPTPLQQRLARALTRAGADVLVGTHAHVLLGGGWLDDSYVAYGLADFVWYHNYRPNTGVLKLRLKDGKVVRHTFQPALIQSSGAPLPQPDNKAAVRQWKQLQSCAGLSDSP